MGDDEGDLLREQARIDRVADEARSRHAIIEFEVPIAVPGQRSDPVPLFEAEPPESIGKRLRPPRQVAIGVAMDRPFHRPRHDFRVAVIGCRVSQD
jgi:hypothetical protein